MKYEKYLNLFDKAGLAQSFYSDMKWSVNFCIRMFNLNVNHLNILVDTTKNQIFLHENQLFIIASLDVESLELNICKISDLSELTFINFYDVPNGPGYQISFIINEKKYTISVTNEYLNLGYDFFADLVKEMKN